MVMKFNPKDVEAVTDAQVDEIYSMWFDTCLPDEAKEAAGSERIVFQHRFATRLLIAEWGMEKSRKIVMALPLSPDHDGSRHRDENGSRLIRRDLSTARKDGGQLIEFWDSRR